MVGLRMTESPSPAVRFMVIYTGPDGRPALDTNRYTRRQMLAQIGLAAEAGVGHPAAAWNAALADPTTKKLTPHVDPHRAAERSAVDWADDGIGPFVRDCGRPGEIHRWAGGFVVSVPRDGHSSPARDHGIPCGSELRERRAAAFLAVVGEYVQNGPAPVEPPH